MAKPITLFTGEPFLIQQELNKRIHAFTHKFGAESIFVFKDHPLPLKQIKEIITGGGLFAQKSCIIVHGIPLSSDDKKGAKEKEEIDEFSTWFTEKYNNFSSDTILIFVSANPDKRGKLYKLFDSATTESNIGIINHPSNSTTAQSLISKQLGSLCSTQDCMMIHELIGSDDLYHIWYETDKLVRYAEHHQLSQLTKEHITSIITTTITQDSFAVIDSILYKHPHDTLSLINRLQQVDDNPYSLLGLLYRGIRGVLMTVDATNHGVTSNTQLGSLTKIPPFTISRITKNHSQLQEKIPYFYSLFHQLIQLEYHIKTGIVPVELFRTQLKTLLIKTN